MAEEASRDLAAIAARLGLPTVSAAAAQARGTLLSARGEAKAAGSALMEALELWLQAGSPYEAARARVLLAGVRRADGDDDDACLELRTACRVFGRIGAVREARAAELQLTAMTRVAGPTLTERQLQVAELVAAGLGNADIAQRPLISRRTAEYHVRQIMMTMGFVSRAQVAAGTAQAAPRNNCHPELVPATSTCPGAGRRGQPYCELVQAGRREVEG